MTTGTITCAELMNKSAAALKAMRGDLPAQVKGDPQLPARFVQALTDAKMRDERMAQQGALITALQGDTERMKHELGVASRERDALREALARAEAKPAALVAQWEPVHKALKKRAEDAEAENRALAGSLTAQRVALGDAAKQELADALRVIAERNNELDELRKALTAARAELLARPRVTPPPPRPSWWSRLWGKG